VLRAEPDRFGVIITYSTAEEAKRGGLALPLPEGQTLVQAGYLRSTCILQRAG
jgi:hypothetical protein